jgi:hypothetical protein
LIAEVCSRVADGETIRQISRDEHMPHAATLYRALGKPSNFCDQYAIAKEAQLTRWEDELIEIADDGSNDWIKREGEAGRIEVLANGEHMQRSRLRVDTRKWVMSKRAPKKYGDRVTNEHTGKDGEPLIPPPLSDFEVARRLVFLLNKGVQSPPSNPNDEADA